MKRTPTLPARMPKPSIHAGCSSIAGCHGVSPGASGDASQLDELALTVSIEASLVTSSPVEPGGVPTPGGGVPPAPPRGGEIGGGGPKEFSRLTTLPASISPLTPTVTPSVQFFMRTERGQNAREHWRDRHRRVQDEKWSTGWTLLGAFGPRSPWTLPLVVTLTRGAPSSGLDDDNLVASLKAIRDAVADWLGVDDKRRDLVRYRYAQERAKHGEWFVRIEFAPMPTASATTQETTP